MEKKKKFKLFDMNRDGRGVEPGEDTRPTLKFFFKQLGRKFWKLFSLNLMMLVQIIPLLLIFYVHLTGPTSPTVGNVLYVPLLGAQTAAPTAAGSALFNTVSGMLTIPTFNTYIYWVIIPLIVFTVVTYGWQKVGSVYVLRNLARGDAVFVVSDYFHAIKRNFGQSFLLGLIDCAVIFMLGFDILYFSGAPAGGFNTFMSAALVAIVIVYLLMSFYTHLMLVTFDMKLSKIFKNALIFSALGIKRNLMALLGIVLSVALSAAIMFLGIQAGIYATIIIPFLILPALIGFIYVYAAYPVIKKYMIDPVQNKSE
ncbi:MAG: DUF624 domain-containing protein [Clostridia bacterium]|nr:DUF624 domain-containing protein [Clostridia bacterium]